MGAPLPLKWDVENNVAWKTPLPDAGNSTPVIWKDRIYLTQAIRDKNLRLLICLDRRTGKILWQSGPTFEGEEKTHRSNPYCAASPTTDGDRIYAQFGSAGVYCFDTNGKVVWKRDLGKQEHIWGYSSSPVLDGDRCILYFGPGENSFMVALNKFTGETEWKHDEPDWKFGKRTDGFRGRDGEGVVGSFTSPLLIDTKGRRELVMSFPTQLVALDPANGSPLWSCDGLNPLVYTSPIYADGILVSMGGYNGSTIAVRAGGKGNVTQERRLWKEVRSKKNYIGSGVIHQGYIYVLNSGGFLECIELESGNKVYEERLKGKGAKGESWSSLLLSGDLIYAINQSGDTFIVKASPEFQLLGTNALGEMTNSSIVAKGNELYIRTHEHLWCIRDSGIGPVGITPVP
jgi:outer membrane protein assembly factor BamB